MTTNTMLNTNNQYIQFGFGALFAQAFSGQTVVAGAVTFTTPNCGITTPTLSTAAGSSYSFTLTNTLITTSSVLLVTYGGGTNTNGKSATISATAGSGTSTVTIYNNNASAAFNGTISLFLIIL